jgi:hypothetical protein
MDPTCRRSSLQPGNIMRGLGHKLHDLPADPSGRSCSNGVPMINFLAFDERGTAIRGRVGLVGDRIADLLALGQPIPLVDVELHDLHSRSIQEAANHVVEPGRLTIVVATGPRGAPSRRVETASRPVTMSTGGMMVHGFLHAPFRADPIAHRFERTWIPLTDAVLEYQGGGRMRRDRFAAVLVNRDAAREVAAISVSAYEVHWLAAGRPDLLREEPIRV